MERSEILGNFTTANSPLPSNQVNTLAINQQTGEVFIGTEKGPAKIKKRKKSILLENTLLPFGVEMLFSWFMITLFLSTKQK